MYTPRVIEEAARDLVQLDGFAVDRTPVTNAQYGRFVDQTGHRKPAYWPDERCPASLTDHPVVGIDYFDAIAYARWTGGRLPTELEWTQCAGLDEPRAFTWGDAFDSARCNTIRSGNKGTTAVGAHAEWASPSGCLDLCGNVWEMTCTADPDHEGTVIVKGGSWYDYPAHAKLDASFHAPIHRVGRTVGFRVVYGGAERHPDFLDAALLDACIDYRHGSPGEEAAEPLEEFDFAALRDDLASAHGLDLAALAEIDDSIDISDEGMDDMLSLFDVAEIDLEADSNSDNGNDIGQALVGLEELYWRMHSFIAERPAILFAGAAAAILLVATTLWASVSEPDTTSYRDDRARIASAAPRPRSNTAKRPSGGTRSNRGAAMSRSSATAARDAIVGLLAADATSHASALRVLQAHGEASRPALELALESARTEAQKLRIRYALAALDEKRDGSGQPHAVSAPPARGLALVCDSFGVAEKNCLRELRRYGAAIGVEVHLVLSGPTDFSRWLESVSADLGEVNVSHDRDRRFVRTLGLRGNDGVIGLHSDGRTAFVLSGLPGRARIEQQVGALY